MKRLLLLICTLLCANVLFAQTEFMVGELLYQVTNQNKVKVKDCVPVATSIIIPTTVSNSGTTYTVTSIGDNAFQDCSSLTSVTIPNSVTSIRDSAFQGCSGLTSVTIGNSVTEIGNSAFEGCSSLTSITIPNSVTYMGYYTFQGCSSLTSITIPNSVTSIEDCAFHSCSSLTSVNIGNSVTSIRDSAFQGCSSLTSVDIPNSVTSIGQYAFEDCSSLTSVNIGNSVTEIGSHAFEDCSSLTSVTIGNSVTEIGSYAFEDCSSLTSVTIPNSVTDIGGWAFDGCSSLTTLNFNAINCNDFYIDYYTFSSPSITTINIGDSVQRIPAYFAYNLNYLTSVTIGNSVTYIGELAFRICSITTLNFNARNCNDFILRNYSPYYDFPPFWSCTITTINIGNSVERIPEYFVIGSDSLTSVTIGNSVTSIGQYAFKDCSSLDTVTCLATAPPTTDGSFSNTPSNKKLIVYCGLKNYYATVWSSYFAYDNIYEIPFAIDVNVNNEVGGNVTVENNCSTATLTATANDCYQFVSWNDGNTENPRIVSLTSDTALTAIFEDLNTELIVNICEGQVYTENNFNVSEAGVYTQTLTSANGCDSIVTLTLNVNPIFNTELTATICEGQVYTENNFNISEAGVYTQTLTSVNGCDSVVTLNLNVNPVYNTDLFASICEGEVYNENGFNVNEAGVYSRTLQAVNGCDSIVTLTLNVNPTFNTELSANICQGQVYTENGFNVSEAGVYTQTLTSANGCDSIVSLTLNVNPTFNTELSATICQGQVYNENGFNVSEAGVYTQTLTSVNGCDSVVTLTVIVNPTFDTTINATINAGETYTEFGFNESEAGTYVQNLQSINGCDSTITLILDVNSSLMDVEHSEISFYPNPTDSKITFSSTIERIEVIDQTGRCVLTFTNAREINIESLPSGAYYLRLTNNDKAIMRKVIKE